jgi:hypothetical protein
MISYVPPSLAENPYHLQAVRTTPAQNLHACFPEVRDEIVCAFNDVLQLQGSGTEEPLLTSAFLSYTLI